MKNLIIQFEAATEYHDGGTKKHFPVINIRAWKEQITTVDDVDCFIIYPIPGATGRTDIDEAQSYAEEWLDIPVNRQSIYTKID